MTVFSLLFSVFGCKKIQPNARHELSELQSVSISCGNSDRSCSYSFSVYYESEKWLFDAECFTDSGQNETSFSKIELTEAELDGLFEILKRNESISYAENYKEPKKHGGFAADTDYYVFALTFSDDTRLVTYTRQSETEEYCYRLAEKYARLSENETDSIENTNTNG